MFNTLDQLLADYKARLESLITSGDYHAAEELSNTLQRELYGAYQVIDCLHDNCVNVVTAINEAEEHFNEIFERAKI